LFLLFLFDLLHSLPVLLVDEFSFDIDFPVFEGTLLGAVFVEVEDQ
jgi:hypothetical protein